MKTEMDVVGMDERQRIAWLSANRVTLFLVGLVWVGMIAIELIKDRVPYFMIAMVPVFAAIRLVSYKMYIRRY